jgi:hypothetical protein
MTDIQPQLLPLTNANNLRPCLLDRRFKGKVTRFHAGHNRLPKQSGRKRLHDRRQRVAMVIVGMGDKDGIQAVHAQPTQDRQDGSLRHFLASVVLAVSMTAAVYH